MMKKFAEIKGEPKRKKYKIVLQGFKELHVSNDQDYRKKKEKKRAWDNTS